MGTGTWKWKYHKDNNGVYHAHSVHTRTRTPNRKTAEAHWTMWEIDGHTDEDTAFYMASVPFCRNSLLHNAKLTPTSLRLCLSLSIWTCVRAACVACEYISLSLAGWLIWARTWLCARMCYNGRALWDIKPTIRHIILDKSIGVHLSVSGVHILRLECINGMCFCTQLKPNLCKSTVKRTKRYRWEMSNTYRTEIQTESFKSQAQFAHKSMRTHTYTIAQIYSTSHTQPV